MELMTTSKEGIYNVRDDKIPINPTLVHKMIQQVPPPRV
jgi:hypothetical protein